MVIISAAFSRDEKSRIYFSTPFSICLSLSLLKFLRLFDELIQGVEAILAAGHMGVIVQLAESCAESEEKQDELMQCLLRVSATAMRQSTRGFFLFIYLPFFMTEIKE